MKRNITIIKNHIDTSKENKVTHGYGLMNIERVTKQYNGILKLICMNKEFIAKATFVFEEKRINRENLVNHFCNIRSHFGSEMLHTYFFLPVIPCFIQLNLNLRNAV